MPNRSSGIIGLLGVAIALPFFTESIRQVQKIGDQSKKIEGGENNAYDRIFGLRK